MLFLFLAIGISHSTNRDIIVNCDYDTGYYEFTGYYSSDGSCSGGVYPDDAGVLEGGRYALRIGSDPVDGGDFVSVLVVCTPNYYNVTAPSVVSTLPFHSLDYFLYSLATKYRFKFIIIMLKSLQLSLLKDILYNSLQR